MRPVLVTLRGPEASAIDALADALAARAGADWAIAGRDRSEDAPKARLILVPGELPKGFTAELDVFVAPVSDTPLLTQVPVDPAEAQRSRMDLTLSDPDALDAVLSKLNARFGNPVHVDDKVRSDFAAVLQAAGPSTREQPHLRWTLSESYAGLEAAQWVVFVLADRALQAQGEQLRHDFDNLRRDPSLFDEVIAHKGFQDDVPAALVDTSNRHDPGVKALFSRLQRLLRR